MRHTLVVAGTAITGTLIVLTGCTPNNGVENVPGHATVTVEYTTADTGMGTETGTVTYDGDITCLYVDEQDLVNYTDDPELEHLGTRRHFQVSTQDGLIKVVNIPFQDTIGEFNATIGAFNAAPLSDEAPAVSDDNAPDIAGMEGKFSSLSGDIETDVAMSLTATTGVVIESDITCQR